MNTAVAPVAQVANTPRPLPIGQARIKGRIKELRRVQFQAGPRWVYVLVMPAVDEYSSPAQVEFSSVEKYGSKGDDISVTVAIGGRPRTYKDTEGNPVQTADNRLTAVE